eukprot:m.76389 g.76389  ORF g.76389 m.76389 type:complete len:544 (+) comp12553_c1_seq3:140-1771(+)
MKKFVLLPLSQNVDIKANTEILERKRSCGVEISAPLTQVDNRENENKEIQELTKVDNNDNENDEGNYATLRHKNQQKSQETQRIFRKKRRRTIENNEFGESMLIVDGSTMQENVVSCVEEIFVECNNQQCHSNCIIDGVTMEETDDKRHTNDGKRINKQVFDSMRGILDGVTMVDKFACLKENSTISSQTFKFYCGGIVNKLPDRDTLRFAASSVAALLGYGFSNAEIPEKWTDLIYQNAPGLFETEAKLFGLEVVNKEEYTASLKRKTGPRLAAELDSIIDAASKTSTRTRGDVATLASRTQTVVKEARKAGRLTPREAKELQREIKKFASCEFGKRHEDSALNLYEDETGCQVHSRNEEPIVWNFYSENIEDALVQESLPVAFCIMGYVDGVSEQLNILSEEEWAMERCVIEVKTRTSLRSSGVPFYEQIQCVLYMKMLNAQRCHLVEHVREGLTGKETARVLEKIKIHEVRLEGAPYHGEQWERTLKPRLFELARAILILREDTSLRYRWLTCLASLEADPDEIWMLMRELAPFMSQVAA